MTDEQLYYFGSLIKDEFYSPIDVTKNGSLQKIWSLLIADCITKAEIANGQEANFSDLREIVTSINSLSLKDPSPD